MNSKGFWYFLQFGAIVLYCGAIILGYLVFPDSPLLWFSFFLFLVIIHISEIPFAMKFGKEKNLSSGITILKIFLFGFTWWLPLKKGIIDS